MYYRYLLIAIIFIALSCKSNSEEKPKPLEKKIELPEIKTANDLIQHAIAYHDPNGNWKNFKSTMLYNSTIFKKEGEKKFDKEIFLDNQNGSFKYYSKNDEITLKGEINSDTCYKNIVKVVSEEVANKYKKSLSCESVKRSKNYYSFMNGLPMKLLDQEAIINDTIFERTYNNVKYDVVKVNYEPVDKNWVWYFYFNKKNHVFKLCKFTSRKDENKRGEYIIYNNEVETNGMKLYNQHIWLYNTPSLDTLAIDNIRHK